MALIVEDGSNVPNANSYVSLDDARAWASLRGLSLPAAPEDDAADALEPLLIKAMDYLEAKRAEYKGYKTFSDQALQWPRSEAYIDDVEFSATAIPKELVAAQVRLAVEAYAGVDLLPTRSTPFVKRSTVGPITTEYSEKLGAGVDPIMSSVEALLKPLLRTIGGLSTVRA